MKFFVLNTKNPHRNLAIEEYLFSHETDDVFMLWQNEPTVVIGKNQNAYAEIHMPFLQEKGIHIARRITGGGAVYHDHGNLNYTFISSCGAKDGIDFAFFTKPILDVLASLGVKAELSGRNDLLVDGRKFSGNAQYSFGGRTLHHGTLLFDSDLSVLSNVLAVDPMKIQSKGIKSTRSRVINLKECLPKDFTVDRLIFAIEQAVTERYSAERCEAPSCAEIEALYERNRSESWIFPQREMVATYSKVERKKYPFGLVELALQMKNDTIEEIRITGDFFGNRSVLELESLLCGATLATVAERLSKISVEEYIHGMSAEELCQWIKTM